MRRSGGTHSRTSTAEGCWPRKHGLQLSGTASWDLAEELQAGTSCSHGRSIRSRGAEAEEEAKHNARREGKDNRKDKAKGK
eukprot:15040910-Heterocapsa_arctica.AAC.1